MISSFTWRTRIKKPAHFLSGQMAALSSFFEVFCRTLDVCKMYIFVAGNISNISRLVLVGQSVHSFHTWPSDASRIESDLMSRWMTPCECRYAIAFRHCLQTVAICSSSSLQKEKFKLFFVCISLKMGWNHKWNRILKYVWN